MNLTQFRTLWGVSEPIDVAIGRALDAGYSGVEFRVPTTVEAIQALAESLQRQQTPWIAEICTGGDYVPPQHLTPAEHLADLATNLDRCVDLKPLHINCLGGVDAWDEPTSVAFLRAGMAMAAERGLSFSFETHRSRILFNPWVTQRLIAEVPELRLTADISHWCVVAERLMDADQAPIQAIASRVDHIHARVGYDQGAQVPHPAAPEYRHCLASHQRCWELFWQAQAKAGRTDFTLTPEFGPDGYLHCLPFTQMPVADLFAVNVWMAETERAHFARWQQSR